MPGFIFEGPDGAGKSFTALEVSRAVGLPIHHFGGPPESKKEIMGRVKFIHEADNLIFDRVPYISDQIYGPIIRRKNSVFQGLDFPEIGFPVIYCRPSLGTILSVKLETKPHKNKEHTDKVKERIVNIVSAYDEIMCKIPHITFNRDKQTCAELISVLEKQMQNI